MKMEEIVEETNGNIGSACPSSFRVHDLRKLIAGKNCLPVENLKLILRGKVLHDREDDDDIYIQLNDGGVDLGFCFFYHQFAFSCLEIQLPKSRIRWKKKLYSFLRHRLKLPDILLMAIFLSLKAWLLIFYGLYWHMLLTSHKWDLGPLYILGTGFCTIFLNLERRQPGELSAYSTFNEDFRVLPGTMNADAIDRDIRTEGAEA